MADNYNEQSIIVDRYAENYVEKLVLIYSIYCYERYIDLNSCHLRYDNETLLTQQLHNSKMFSKN